VIEILKIVDLRLRLRVVVAAVTHVGNIVELRARAHLLDIREEDVLMTLRIARITEKITINNVFQLVVHSYCSPMVPSTKYVTSFLGFHQ